MGIYDRDYYRREGHSFLGSFTERGTICKWLIGINVAVFAAQLLAMPTPPVRESGPITDFFVLDRDAVFHGEIYRLLTYAFLHSPTSFMHIFFNMFFLWIFGRDVEDLYGPREFLAFYLTSAVAGGMLYLVTPFFNMGSLGPCLGASGAVIAVTVLCACHFPDRNILVFMVFPVPIWFCVIFEVGYDAYALLSRAQTTTAVAAHLGGAMFAFGYYKFHWRLMPFWRNVTQFFAQFKTWRKRRSQPRLRVYRELEEEERSAPVGVAAVPPPPQGRPDDEQLEAKMDAVLEKISRVGKENLTDSDREVLRLAAEAIKRRRS